MTDSLLAAVREPDLTRLEVREQPGTAAELVRVLEQLLLVAEEIRDAIQSLRLSVDVPAGPRAEAIAAPIVDAIRGVDPGVIAAAVRELAAAQRSQSPPAIAPAPPVAQPLVMRIERNRQGRIDRVYVTPAG